MSVKVQGRVIISRNRNYILSVAELDCLGEININENFIISNKEVFAFQDSVLIIVF